jgi:hypothetical protein
LELWLPFRGLQRVFSPIRSNHNSKIDGEEGRHPRGGWAVGRASATMISMAVESVTRDDRVLPLTRAVAYAIVPFLLAAFAVLYLGMERR